MSVTTSTTPGKPRTGWRRRTAAIALAALAATVGAVLAPWSASPAQAAVGSICYTTSGWPSFPPGSLYITAVGPFPFTCNGSPIDPATGFKGLTYVTSGDVNEGTVVCWRWTQQRTGSDALPPGFAYRDGFLTTPGCAARIVNGQPVVDSGNARVVYCSVCPHPDDRIDLRLYWNPDRADNITTNATTVDGYSYVGTVGQVFRGQVSGTVPLRLYWNPDRADNITTNAATVDDYSFVGVVGYVFC